MPAPHVVPEKEGGRSEEDDNSKGKKMTTICTSIHDARDRRFALLAFKK